MNDEVLVKPTRDPLFGNTRAELTQRFREALSGRVAAAYYFGSFAEDRMTSDSDIDMLLVVETATPFLERNREFSDLLDIVPSMDILVYTPEEFRSLTDQPAVGFWRSTVASLRRFV